MAAQMKTLVPRLFALALVALLSTATLTFAADNGPSSSAPTPTAAKAPEVLSVPDVRGQAFVFAKGMLEEAGFAWRVDGSVQGFSANLVSSQWPAAGARVLDTGSPTIVLNLARSAQYPEDGAPEDVSPYDGSAIRFLTKARPVVKATPKAKPPAHVKPEPRVKPQPKAKAKVKPKQRPKARADRTPAFLVPGAPKEPLDEITLSERANRLLAWAKAHPQANPALVRHWLYQHSWIVTGAKFGWSHGAEALQTLIEVDAVVQRQWGFGSRSAAVARAALTEVEAKTA